MQKITININAVVAAKSDNYYEPLGMDRARSLEIIRAVQAAFKTKKGHVLDIIAEISKDLRTNEEVIFAGFKAGEMYGMAQAVAHPMAAIEVFEMITE